MANFGPYTIDHVTARSLLQSLVIDVVLAGFFAIPHSIFARPGVKNSIGEGSMYRSIYVLQSTVALNLIIVYWQPVWVDIVLWEVPALIYVYLVAFLWTLTATFAIDHFELFGVVQTTGFDAMDKLGLKASGFTRRLHYGLCRHPIMTGFFGLFFLVPTMTVNHLFFSVTCAAYILLAVFLLEEPDLLTLCTDYKQYQVEVPAFCPLGFACRPRPAGAREQKEPLLD